LWVGPALQDIAGRRPFLELRDDDVAVLVLQFPVDLPADELGLSARPEDAQLGPGGRARSPLVRATPCSWLIIPADTSSSESLKVLVSEEYWPGPIS
jgi:hypothetical protein